MGGGDSSPLDAVAEARERASIAEEALRVSVERAREAGNTWQEIGVVLGTTRQAAFQRFGRPVDPRTGADLAGDVLPGAEDRAVALIGELVAGRWEEARRDFDAAMRTEVTVDRIVAVWTEIAATIGRYERMGTPITRRVGDHTLVSVPLYCEAGEVTARIAVNADGSVGGLHLLPG